MPRRRKNASDPVAPTLDEIRERMLGVRREMLVLIQRGYGWPGVQQAIASSRDEMDRLRVEHPEIWKTLPMPENDKKN